jgi:hypothetical protein
MYKTIICYLYMSINASHFRDFQRKKRSTITLDYTKYPQTIFRGQEVLPVLSW